MLLRPTEFDSLVAHQTHPHRWVFLCPLAGRGAAAVPFWSRCPPGRNRVRKKHITMASEAAETQPAEDSHVDDTSAAEMPANEAAETASGEVADDDNDADEVVVQIGDAEPPPPDPADAPEAPEWLKKARREAKETMKEARRLQAEAKAVLEQRQTKDAGRDAPVLKKKPTLSDEDIDFDARKYEARLDEWKEQERRQQIAHAAETAARQKETDEWQATLGGYAKAKTALKVRDFDDAEATVLEVFAPAQQGVIVKASKNSALVVYALGKDPKKAKELAAIKDHIMLAVAVADLERTIKMTSRKPASSPEEKFSGAGTPAVGGDSKTLARLEAEADKTGDRSKIAAYKREQRNKISNKK